MQHKYLFILSGPYSGSTVLWRLLQTSTHISALPCEGQKLPALSPMMRDDPWNPERVFDWAQIRRVWEEHWDLDKPVLLEKSPPHLCRAEVIDSEFQPARFILLLRDPLAVCEALHRRNGLSYSEAARRWLHWLKLHIGCRARLPGSMVVSYEAMTEQPRRVFTELGAWLPELADVNWRAPILAHSVEGVRERPLINLNRLKLERVSLAQRQEVFAVLAGEREAIQATPYSYVLSPAGN